MDGVAVGIHRHRRQERHLVLRAAPGRAAAELAAEVGVVHLDLSAEDVAILALDHRLHELVVDQPGSRVTDSQEALQRQGRQPGLGLADEIDGRETHRQGQLGPLKQRPSDQGGLLTAGPAWKTFHAPTRSKQWRVSPQC